MCTKSYENGLSRDQLSRIIDIITLPNELDQPSISNIIMNLYPASRVTEDNVLKVVVSLGHGQRKASFPTQTALLNWLILVYDVLESQKVLSRLYSLLFNLLDTIAIRYGR